jgi:hypothetical protein
MAWRALLTWHTHSLASPLRRACARIPCAKTRQACAARSTVCRSNASVSRSAAHVTQRRRRTSAQARTRTHATLLRCRAHAGCGASPAQPAPPTTDNRGRASNAQRQPRRPRREAAPGAHVARSATDSLAMNDTETVISAWRARRATPHAHLRPRGGSSVFALACSRQRPRSRATWQRRASARQQRRWRARTARTPHRPRPRNAF